MTDFISLTNPDAKEWDGLRLPARTRIASACRHLMENGELQRADVMRIGEVSQPQASGDIRQILDRVPEFMEYDKSRRCYVRKDVSGES